MSYLDPYRKSHKRHGAGFEVTLWANQASQERRFRLIAQVGHLADKRLLDAGCSRGDLAHYLLEHQVPFAGYVGVDGLCEVVDFARSRRLPRCEFHCGDLLAQPQLLRTGDPQVVIISGTLNTMTDAQVGALLESAWLATSESLIFNFLSDRAAPNAPPQHGPARRLDTMKLIDWALRKTHHVAFRQDYFKAGHDATIVMKKA